MAGFEVLDLDAALAHHRTERSRRGVSTNDLWQWRDELARDLRARLHEALAQLDRVESHGRGVCGHDDECAVADVPLAALNDTERLDALLHDIDRLVPEVEGWCAVVVRRDKTDAEGFVYFASESEQRARDARDALERAWSRRGHGDRFIVAYRRAALHMFYREDYPLASLEREWSTR